MYIHCAEDDRRCEEYVVDDDDDDGSRNRTSRSWMCNAGVRNSQSWLLNVVDLRYDVIAHARKGTMRTANAKLRSA